MTWTVGISDTWTPVNQLDGSAAAAKNCAQANLAAIGQYLTGVKKSGAEVRTEGWPSSSSITDYPGMESYAASWMATAISDVHAPSPADAAHALWQCLFWGRPSLFLVTLNGTDPHWATALRMTGGASPNPFDSLLWNNSIGGKVQTSTYAQWAASLFPYQGDGTYLVLPVNRDRSIVADTRMGPS